MFNYIKGTKEYASGGIVVVETGGIGYELNVSSACESAVSSQNEVKLYTYLAVREEGVTLYGFYSLPEKEMFLQLISVSGIGPKVALAILSGISVDKLAANIISQDVSALNKVKGVGKKTAARIVLELKDKITKDFEDSEDSLPAEESVVEEGVNDEAVLALMTLGFTRKEAADKVAKVAIKGMSVEDIVFNALKNA